MRVLSDNPTTDLTTLPKISEDVLNSSVNYERFSELECEYEEYIDNLNILNRAIFNGPINSDGLNFKKPENRPMLEELLSQIARCTDHNSPR
jgi:hypothetical protein